MQCGHNRMARRRFVIIHRLPSSRERFQVKHRLLCMGFLVASAPHTLEQRERAANTHNWNGIRSWCPVTVPVRRAPRFGTSGGYASDPGSPRMRTGY
jgi:hypothetical protein